MSRRRLARNALASVVQVLLTAAILFELFRFLTRHLTISQIGLWSLVLASASVGRLTDMGIGGGVVKFVAGDVGRDDRRMAARTVGMGATAMAGFVGLACALLYPALWRLLGALVSGAELLGTARRLLPFALASLWLGALSGVFLSALDGCQRTDLRACVSVSGSVGQLCVAYFAVPGHGLTGVAVAQVAQGGVMLVGAALLVAHQLWQPGPLWLGWDRKRFRELLRYGGGVQLGTVGQLLFEPTVKALLARFGGLAITGYYEMANRLISQARAVIVSAYQALVPYVASLNRTGSDVRPIYIAAHQTLVFLAVPYYAVVGAALPALLTVWLGRFEPEFLRTALVCLAGWAVNTLNVPAYFMYLALGRLRWTILSHVVIGALNVVLAGALGWLAGGIGVVIGAALALAMGSLVVPVVFNREHGLPLPFIIPKESRGLAVVGLSGTGLAVWAATAYEGSRLWTVGVWSAPVMLGTIVAAITWRHPRRQALAEFTWRAALGRNG